MDLDRFDQIARMFSATDSRRGLLRLGAALPLVGSLSTLLGESGVARRRKRKRRRRGKVVVCLDGETFSVPRSAVRGVRLAGGTQGACASGGGGAEDGFGAGDPCLPDTADLQGAIDTANPGDTIRLCAGTWSLTSFFGFGLLIDKNLTLVGAGSGQSIIDGTRSVRVLQIAGSADATLQDLTITNGTATSGGGIINFGTLTLVRVTVSDNHASQEGAGIYNDGGTVTLGAGTSVTGNTALDSGGGIYNDGGAVTLQSGSQVANNHADAETFDIAGGGGIFNQTGGILTLEAGSQVSENSATPTIQAPPGGGVLNIRPGRLVIANNTIVTGNTPDDVCDFDPVTTTCV